MSAVYEVCFSPAAQDDIRAIYTYIARELKAKRAAASQVNRIRKAIRALDELPTRHRVVDWEPWASVGMRKMPVDNYVVFYLVDDEKLTVTIVRVFYGGRDIESIACEFS